MTVREAAKQWWPIVLQLAVLVWGASAVKSSVDQLKDSVHEIRTEQKAQGGDITTLKIDVAIIKAKVKP